jgi:hypothetical protein
MSSADKPSLLAYVINPRSRMVHPIRWDGALDTIYSHLKCECVDLLRVDMDEPFDEEVPSPPKGFLYVDDDGLLKDDQRFFILKGANADYPIAGIAMVVGPGNAEGDDTDAPFELNEVIERVVWIGTESDARKVVVDRDATK